MTSLTDSETLWSLRTDEIPGQVWRDSRSNDSYIRIKVGVSLKGPDGSILGEVDFTKIGTLPRVDKGQLVLFRIAKAGQQLYIDQLRVITPADYIKAKQVFASSYAAKLLVLHGRTVG